MSAETERRERWLARRAFQRLQDQRLAGDSEEAAAVRARWQPMEDFVTEGPDIGEREEPESEEGQRFN